MSVTAQTVKDIAPELAEESDSRLELFISYAALSVNESVWGTKYDLGVATMTAHLLSMANRGGAGGPLTSEKVGDLARSYGQSQSKGNEELSSTSYGQWFLQLRRTLPITPVCL